MYDQVDDFNPTYWFAAADAIGDDNIPEYMKTAGVITREEVSELGDSYFALPDKRLWPMHTKAATLMSAASFYSKKLKLPEVEQALKMAAQAHDIESDVARVLEIFSTAGEKTAGVSSPHYALFVDTGGGSISAVYPCEFPGDLLKSARQLPGDLANGRLSKSFARDAAQALMKRAAELKLSPQDLPESTQALARVRTPNFDIAMCAVDARVKYAGINAEAEDVYRGLVESAKEAYHNDTDPLADFIEVFEDLDTTYGVKYSALVQDPHDSFYSGDSMDLVVKYANEVVFVGDQPVPSEVVARVGQLDHTPARFSKASSTVVLEAAALAVDNPAKATMKLAALNSDEQEALLQLALEAA